MLEILYDNKYKYVKRLGSGGFGEVFLAIEEYSENLVAIKNYHSIEDTDLDLLLNELQTISRFNHPNIVSYKHSFIEEENAYLVMEYCERNSLRQMMLNRTFVTSYIWKWMLTLTETMQFVHDKGIVHHDLKPDNILFTQDRVIKIGDFGLANIAAGTHYYICPRASENLEDYSLDIRMDIYSLGVTLLEVLTGINPFFEKSTTRIRELYYQSMLNIEGLQGWEQAIILKAVHPEPELRFQTMQEFHEAIKEQAIPFTLNKDAIKAGDFAEKANQLIKNKKWLKALSLLDYAEKNFNPSISVMETKGKYYLMQGNTALAKQYFEKALKWNPRINIQKELGWINLDQKNYPMAISMLSDYIHRNPTDMEAYNLLMKCYYETKKYEQVINIAEPLLKINPGIQCLQNNLYLAIQLFCIKEKIEPKSIFNKAIDKNHFINYNYGLVTEKELTHNYSSTPSLKSRMLYMDYRFNGFTPGTVYITNETDTPFEQTEFKDPIIKFGRKGYEVNNIEVSEDNNVSRRHCVIINSKDDVWLYNLSDLGTTINEENIMDKSPLLGRNTIEISESSYELTTDKGKLF